VGIEVIVKLAPAMTAASSPARRSLDACLVELGVSLAPLYAPLPDQPAPVDQDLASYFIAHIDAARLDDVIDRVRRCEGVEAAYVKPRGEPPERM
jgi:hypothetical protein